MRQRLLPFRARRETGRSRIPWRWGRRNFYSSCRQPKRGLRLRGYTLATARETHAVHRRRLYADARDIDREDFCNARAHAFAMWGDLGPFADECHVDMHDLCLRVFHELSCMGQEFVGGCTAPLGIVGWKM